MSRWPCQSSSHTSTSITPCESKASSSRKLEAALSEQNPQDHVQARVELARQNTWAVRFATLDQEIRSLYGRVAIIVVSFDNLNELRLCLSSLWSKTTYPNFEVIVVDNGSRPEVRWISRRSPLRSHVSA